MALGRIPPVFSSSLSLSSLLGLREMRAETKVPVSISFGLCKQTPGQAVCEEGVYSAWC